jgi:hypothetical protein
MIRILRVSMAAVCAVTIGACAPGARPSAPPPQRNVIERSEIEGSQYGNAYLLVQALRPQWLEVRPVAITSQQGKRVYLDNVLLGDVTALRQITIPSIASIHYYDAPAATQRWGTGHAAGAIQIRSRTR